MSKFLGVILPSQPHRCDLPESSRHIKTYTGWQCDCGKAYRLEPFQERNEAFRQWTRYPAADAVGGLPL